MENGPVTPLPLPPSRGGEEAGRRAMLHAIPPAPQCDETAKNISFIARDTGGQTPCDTKGPPVVFLMCFSCVSVPCVPKKISRKFGGIRNNTYLCTVKLQEY